MYLMYARDFPPDLFSVGYFDSPEQKIIHRIAPTSNRHNGSNSATSTICSEDALWKTPIYRFADDTDRTKLVKLILERSSKDKTLKAACATLEKWIDSISANTQSEDE